MAWLWFVVFVASNVAWAFQCRRIKVNKDFWKQEFLFTSKECDESKRLRKATEQALAAQKDRLLELESFRSRVEIAGDQLKQRLNA